MKYISSLGALGGVLGFFVCDQVNEVDAVHEVDKVDDVHQVDPVHQVHGNDEVRVIKQVGNNYSMMIL